MTSQSDNGYGTEGRASAVHGGRGLDFDLVAAHLKPLASQVRLRILDLLSEPRYLESIAQELGITRQAVRKHLDRLIELGVVIAQDAGPRAAHSKEFVLDRSRIFQLQAEFQRLGRLRTDGLVSHDPTTVEGRTSSSAPRSIRSEPRLVTVRGLDEGTVYRLALQPGRVWRLGRAPGSEVPVAYDPYASMTHAELRCHAGSFLLVDQYSRNGTTLNGRPLLRGGEAPIHPGDLIGIGKSLFVFQPGASTVEAANP